jgi:hypothetical protein
MARQNYLARDGVVAAIAFVLSRVPQEDAHDGARAELVGGSSGGVRIAEASEHSEPVILWWCTEKELVRSEGRALPTGTPVE